VFHPAGTYLRRFPAGSGATRRGGLAICPVSGDVVVGTDRGGSDLWPEDPFAPLSRERDDFLVGTDQGGVSFWNQQGVRLADRRLIPVDGTPIGANIGIAIDQKGGIVVSSSTGLQTFSSTGHSTNIVFPEAINQSLPCVGVSPEGDILIHLEDPVLLWHDNVSVFSPMGKLLQIIGYEGDSPVPEVERLCGLTVDERGTVWFSSPEAVFTLRAVCSAPPPYWACACQQDSPGGLDDV